MKGESPPKPRGVGSREDAEALAAQAFGRLADDDERLGRFLALSGLDPRSLRSAANSADFLPAVLEYVRQDERLLLAISDEIGVDPSVLATAAALLSDPGEFQD